jgi:2-methylcitrate dehydratase PrpD
MATALVNGTTGVQSFTLPNVENPEILALARKVKVVEDPAMTASLPHKRPARVTLSLNDGTVLQAATETNRGDWSDPYPPDEIREKYLSLTTRLWREDAGISIWDMVMDLRDAASLDPLFSEMALACR